MIFRISKSVILLGLIVCAFLACTNSDDYLFNEQDLQEIEVSAVITNSFENDAEKKKTDTIQPEQAILLDHGRFQFCKRIQFQEKHQRPRHP